MFKEFKNKLYIRFSVFKSYIKLLSDFTKLNKYIFLSNKCLNRIEIILDSSLPEEVVLNNIKIIYSDFKNDFETEDFINGVNVINKFDRGGKEYD